MVELKDVTRPTFMTSETGGLRDNGGGRTENSTENQRSESNESSGETLRDVWVSWEKFYNTAVNSTDGKETKTTKRNQRDPQRHARDR